LRYRLRDAHHVLRTPIGRSQVWSGVLFRAWPLMSRLAGAWRRTALRHTRLVAVVGSYGKTTTTRAIAQVLDRPLSPRIELNDKSFMPLALLKTEPGARNAVIEVGIDHPGQMRRFAAVVRPTACVVTSVGSEHNRSLGSLEITRHEKAEMVRRLPPTGFVAANHDDENTLWMAAQSPARRLTFGFHTDSDFRALEPRLVWPHGTEFTLLHRGQAATVRTRLLGRHMVYPALAALAVAVELGIDLQAAIARLAGLPPTPGRMELIPIDNGVTIIGDYYKSGLETIYSALDFLEQVPAKRRIVVLGDVSEPPGSQGPIYRAVGARIAGVADIALFSALRGQAYASGAAAAGMARAGIIQLPRDVLEVTARLRELLRAGDVVLIKARDTQRFDRIALALAGRRVRCNLDFCRAMPTRCGDCGMLERGWDGLKVIF